MIKRIICVAFLLCFLVVNVGALNASEISAECAVVICADTGEVVFEKNAKEQHSMASTTKIMTTLLAVESGKLNAEIKVKEDMLKVEGTSMGLKDGDSVYLGELTYGMLLPSGNDAANVTAIYLGGTVENFAKMMNLRAKEIGMNNTNFVTPSGLDNDNHYSTAYDMALLGAEAVRNRAFLKVCSSKKATLTYGNPPYSRTLYNHNRMLSSYSGALGIKTGFTKKSGRCLVSYAQRDGKRLVAVTLNDKNDWQDQTQMLDYGFESVKIKNISTDDPTIISVVGGTSNNVPIASENITLSYCNNQEITKKTYVKKFLYAPVKRGEIVGHTDVYCNDKLIGTITLTADSDINIKTVSKQKSTKKYNIIEKLKERFND